MSNGFSSLHIPSQLKAVGFSVATCGNDTILLHRSRYIDKYFIISTENQNTTLSDFIHSCQQWQPDLILPVDETAVKYLHSFVRQLANATSNQDLTWLQQQLQAALGHFPSGQVYQPRATLYSHAKANQIATPEQHQVNNRDESMALASHFGYPVVLKREWSCAGRGVRICHNDEALHVAWQELDQGRNPAYPLLLQRYIQGKVIMHAMAVWQGKVVAGISAWQEVSRGPSPTHPSRVIRFTQSPQLAEISQRLLADSGFCGFAAFDFMVESDSNRLFLIEFNGRWIQAAGFGPRLGVNLCQALWHACHGHPFKPTHCEPFDQQVAFFPNEWLENPLSPLLHAGQCDIPWHDPNLFAAAVQLAIQEYSPALGHFLPHPHHP